MNRSRSRNRSRGGGGKVTAGDTTPPTLTSASVANATPSQIDLVWSEPMNINISAFSAFAVSAGHTLTAHTYVDSTHTNLTTSTAFVNGEAARTLAYTQPGSNNMQDLAGNLLANIAAASITNNVSAGKITFTDDFTGTDGSAPNARWTLRDAGWTIQTNKLAYNGASFGIISAACTAGDNTVTVDVDFSNANSSFAIISVGFVDGNNYLDVSLNASEVLQIREIVAGVASGVTTTDPGGVRLSTAATVQVAKVGSLITVTVTGGLNPGNFNATLAGTYNSATKIAFGMNTGKPANTFDNCILS